MRGWPDLLPLPVRDGYGLAPLDPTDRTQMETGLVRARRRTKARGDNLRVTWRFTDAEMEAFRAWAGDEARSVAGDSDDLSSWTASGASPVNPSIAGPDDVLTTKIVEDGATSDHYIQLSLGNPVSLQSGNLVFMATMKAAGRTWARLVIRNQTPTVCRADFDLSAGSVGSTSGIASASIADRGNGWWRCTVIAPLVAGGSNLQLRAHALSANNTSSYAGNGTSGVYACEVMARVQTGFDLFVRSGPDGNALGADGGAAWFTVPLAFGGGIQTVEARFSAPWSARILDGLNWEVTGELEVRNA